MKRIAIFADGTWNAPVRGQPTNVLQLTRGVRPKAGGSEQIVFYDWGVGTDRKELAGGLTGEGIDKNIRDCYRFLVHNYEPGDKLYFFGFSRGAYTVRSLAGLIRNCGLLKREHAGRIPEAYRLYRKRGKSGAPSQPKAVRFRRDYAVADLIPIEFVGVWDTVGTLGVPVPFWGTLDREEFLFHNTEPSKIIRHARHAVSIDENRADFEPTLWSTKPGLGLKQVWFAGVHSDVGGGYKERGLSHCAARWILDKAAKHGLRFEPHLIESIQPDFAGKLHNERTGIYRIRDKLTRTVAGPVHDSVKKRWDADVDGYRRKSKPLKRLLESVDGDWSKIELAE